MKIVTESVPACTLEEFADKYDLIMIVKERPLPEGDPSRFYARFEGVEVGGDGTLTTAFGNGATPEDAMAAYAERIYLATLVVDAHKDSRRQIPPHRISP